LNIFRVFQRHFPLGVPASGGEDDAVIRINHLRAVLFCCLGISLAAIRLSGAEAATNSSPRLKPIPPCPALVAAARTNNISLEQVDPPVETDIITPGDSITTLVTLCKKDAQPVQWLVYLQAVEPDPTNQPVKPPAPMVMYSSCGNRLEFVSSPAFVTVRTLGPLSEAGSRKPQSKSQDKSVRLALDKGFLSIGFDQAAAIILRIRKTGVKGSINFGPKPFSDAEISTDRKLADAVKLTPAEERAFGGSCPALLSFFNIIQQTPGLNAILFDILDLPPMWSLVRHGGVQNANFRFQPYQVAAADAAPWGLPAETPVYHFPMVLELDRHPALNLTLVVTPAHPPFLACAGIVGMLVERPGDKDTYLTLRVLSARRSNSKP
jgi:hypothetical protein